ncbi:MAG: rhodanese-like domain-containing protein [Lachnospiraceae bacterium]|nr:rhodanese-like domain-containing protein [Lachnospiraceae bacterium]
MYRYIITLSELKKMQSRGTVVLADIREGEDYRKGHIPGAVSVPYDEEQDFLGHFKKTEMIVLYCDRGNLSTRVTARMRRAGYQAYSLSGGYAVYARFQK